MDRDTDKTKAGADRREFLGTAGKFAVITPPLMTLLLSTSLSSPAIAASGSSYSGGDDDGNNGNHYGQIKNGH